MKKEKDRERDQLGEEIEVMSIVHPTQRVCTQKKKKDWKTLTFYTHMNSTGIDTEHIYYQLVSSNQPFYLSLIYTVHIMYMRQTVGNEVPRKKKKLVEKTHRETTREGDRENGAQKCKRHCQT